MGATETWRFTKIHENMQRKQCSVKFMVVNASREKKVDIENIDH